MDWDEHLRAEALQGLPEPPAEDVARGEQAGPEERPEGLGDRLEGHAELGEGVLATAGPEQMSMTVHQLTNDESLWQLHASAATRSAALQLADFEVAHDLRRALLRVSEEG